MQFDLRYFQVLGGTIVLFSDFTDQQKAHELQAFGGSAIADGLLSSAAIHVVAKIYTEKVSMMLMSMLFSMTSVIEFYSIDQPVLHRIYIAHDSPKPKAPGFMQAHQAQKDDKHAVKLPWSESFHQPSALLVLVLQTDLPTWLCRHVQFPQCTLCQWFSLMLHWDSRPSLFLPIWYVM